MSVALMQSPSLNPMEKSSWSNHPKQVKNHENAELNENIWSAIIVGAKQSESNNKNPLSNNQHPLIPYANPTITQLSQRSLEVCTENLGSETVSDYYEIYDETDRQNEAIPNPNVQGLDYEEEEEKDLNSVNYHCHVSRRTPVRSFPPPLPSISRQNGPCVHMRPHRRDGRLVVEAVPVPSQNYLHARRGDGRLLLSFVDAALSEGSGSAVIPPKDDEANDDVSSVVEVDEDEEEEVEVVDRGTIVEVNVSTRATKATHRSSLVINKFVGGTPAGELELEKTGALTEVNGDGGPCGENKVRFVSKRRNGMKLSNSMRRCSQLRRPLFIWEPCSVTA